MLDSTSRLAWITRTIAFVCAVLGPIDAYGRASDLKELTARVRDVERIVVAAERVSVHEPGKTAAELAKRLVAGQVLLEEGAPEPAAIIFLDLMENHTDTAAAPQAQYFLGEALMKLDLPRWATECFALNLGDERVDARRFHQRSIARLLDLALPRRESGFARLPGTAATPETRARLESVGASVTSAPPKGSMAEADEQRLERWVQSIAPADRSFELHYAYGRYLLLRGRAQAALEELDAVSPPDAPWRTPGKNRPWRVRAAYLAATAMVQLGEWDQAISRFAHITTLRTGVAGERQIIELSRMAIGRIHHDRSEFEQAMRAYRRVGRDSPFFSEALYETAWTLLRAGQHDRAAQALDLLLVYDADSPLAAEIKQLRGKIKIQARDWQAAEQEFLALRREFSRMAVRLARQLEQNKDASRYFAAVVGEDMQHFTMASIMPGLAARVANSLPRAKHAETLARGVGALEQQLFDTRALLARMEEAVHARDRAKLFIDLGAHLASLETAAEDLIEIEEALVQRAAESSKSRSTRDLERQRTALRGRVDAPLGAGESSNSVLQDILALDREAHKLDLAIASMRAQLVATERYYDETRKDQKIDRQGFLNQAAELRDTIAALEHELRRVRDNISTFEGNLRFHDPWRRARADAFTSYRSHLDRMYRALSTRDPQADALWRRALGLAQRIETGRNALDRTAAVRLRFAMGVLVEERANLDRYSEELELQRGRTRDLVGDVMHASYRDVVAELENLVIRSEVGLLDVAWSMKEVEADEVRRLERDRERDLRDLDTALQQGLEDLQ